MKNLYFLLSGLLISVSATAQFSVSPGSAQQIADKITGPGVSISNVVLNCPSNASGVFTGGGPANLGLDSGAILTTGTITGIGGPNATTFISQSSSAPGDALLTSTSSAYGCSVGYDACVLTFSLVPLCDTIRLHTIFASEEYNEFVAYPAPASVNDVWGFYVSGPNPTGGNYTNVNIATIPGTTTPVTINTVNNLINQVYYRDNSVTPQPVVSAYDGLTTVLYHTLHVVPGSTYNLKLAIQDCGDGSYDSGVFLNAEGISCPDTSLTLTSSESVICAGDTVTLFASGLVNYNWSPSSAVSPPSGPVVTTTPTTTTTYVVQGNNMSGTFYIDSITITVLPQPVAGTITATQTPTPSSLVVCTGDSVELTVNGNSGTTVTWLYSNNNVTWDTLISGTPADSVISTGPLNTSTVYQVHVSSGPCEDVTPPITISVVPAPIPDATDATICQGSTAGISASGGTNYQWSPVNTLDDPLSATPVANPTVTTTYYVTVFNQFGCSATDSSLVVVNNNPTVFPSTLPAVCPQSNGTILIDSANGAAPLSYSLDNVTFTQTTSITGLATANYTLYVEDGNGCTTSVPVFVSEVMDVVAAFTPDPESGKVPLTVNFTNTSTGNIGSYHWNFGNGMTSSEANPVSNYEDHGTYSVILYAYGQDPRCLDTASFTIVVEGETEIFIPNVFSPNGDGTNDFFQITGSNVIDYEIEIFDQWGKKVHSSNDIAAGWDGKRRSGGEASAGTYYFVITYTTLAGEVKNIKGYLTLFR